MAKPTGPMQEVARLLDLVPYLSTHSYISMKELAQEFGISERDLANELTALSMCGLPGYTPYELIEIFFESGFVTINNHDPLDMPRALSQLEVASLLLGLELLRESLTDSKSAVEGEIESLISQLRNLAGDAVVAEPTSEYAHLSEIQKSIARRGGLLITYLSTQRDVVEERLIEPLEIYFDSGVSYLSAYCHRADGYRNFRIDRIESLSPATIESGKGGEVTSVSGAISLSLALHSAKRQNSELFSLTSISPQGRAIAEIYNEEWAIRAVLSASPGVEVLEPSALRSAIAAEGRKILALYRS